MKGSTFLVLALISYSLSSPVQSGKEDDSALLESLFIEDRDAGFHDDSSPKETSDLAALEEIADTGGIPIEHTREKVEKLDKARDQESLKAALHEDKARDQSNAMSKEEGKKDTTWQADGIPIDVLADYERRPKEDESSLGEFAGIKIGNDEITHKEQSHRRQDERRTSADYEERPKKDENSLGAFAGMKIGNDEKTHKEQSHRRQDERRTSANYEERPKEDEKSLGGFAGIRIPNDEATQEQSHPKEDERRTSADYEERPKEDEKSLGGFAGIRIPNDEATQEQSHPKEDERRTSAATSENVVHDSSVSDLFEEPSGNGEGTENGALTES